MIKRLFRIQAVILALIVSLTITLLVGCFANAPLTMDKSFSGKYWYYVNRGYPTAWSGVSLKNTKLDFPLVQAPFITMNDGIKTEFIKIIDLKIFIPILLVIFLVAYLPSFVFAKAADENKQLFPFLILADVLFGVLGVLIYFSWFSRI